ncbi:hypothetical protein MMAG44476_21952 [Mycolicibacterium mageritense DSM 44476 = CIP 104973]|jgi:hypothetical protein|nr:MULTISPECIES: hypothetical protein [Mycolicibacterium]MCC9179528.1 hypothetical protein [Mycolicibacterium mageritense]MCV7211467.1 hypothetical protein [Mycolicibacterium canariasense]ORV10498.1 hypothetical protein AWB94_07310 [Mycolicibacterium canariasense]
MTYNGWTNDHTWGVAGACDNTGSFQDTVARITAVALGGDIAGAADQLRDSVAVRGAVASTLPSWVDLAAVNWTELVTSWAQDAA